MFTSETPPNVSQQYRNTFAQATEQHYRSSHRVNE
jgi:hypothetical protein